jgi:hypothetical protein
MKTFFINKKALLLLGMAFFLLLLSTAVFAQSSDYGRDRGTTKNVEFDSNIYGTSVSINGVYKGTTPITLQLSPGTYTLTATATGYRQYTATITVTNDANQTIKILLEPAMVKTTITANVSGAYVYINDQYKGVTPITLDLTPGSYTLKLTAYKYETLVTSLSVSNQQSQTFNYTLVPQKVTLNIVIPAQFLDPNSYNNTIKVYIDGRLMNAQGSITQLVVEPGSHTIRLSSPAGGFSVSKTFVFESGGTYQIEVAMDLILKLLY